MNEIIVGVDDSLAAAATAAEAAVFAARTGRGLHLVMAVRSLRVTTVSGPGSDCWRIDPLSCADETVRALAGAIGAAVEVTHNVVVARTREALRDEAVRLGASMVIDGTKRTRHLARRRVSAASDIRRELPVRPMMLPAS